MSCTFCKAEIYIKVKQYARPILAPLTYAGELQQKLEDTTGDTFVVLPRKFCPVCGKRLIYDADVVNSIPKTKLSMLDMNSLNSIAHLLRLSGFERQAGVLLSIQEKATNTIEFVERIEKLEKNQM